MGAKQNNRSWPTAEGLVCAARMQFRTFTSEAFDPQKKDPFDRRTLGRLRTEADGKSCVVRKLFTR
jgi:hypothetical protein